MHVDQPASLSFASYLTVLIFINRALLVWFEFYLILTMDKLRFQGVSNAAAGFREPRKFLRRNVKLRCPGTKNGKTVVISCDGTQKKKKTEDSDGRILSSSSGEEQCLNRTGAEGKGSAVPLRILTKEKNYFEANDPFLNKRPPERLGESSVNSDYHVVDCTEVKLNISSYKMVMLTNKFVIFYHRYTLRRARQVSLNH